MNNQDVFNKVWKHFILEQNPFGFDIESKKCLYLSPSGAKCAIGCCFPDGMFEASMNMVSAEGLLDGWNNVKKLFADCSRSFLCDIQNDHDENSVSSDYEGMQRDFIHTARAWGLEVPLEA